MFLTKAEESILAGEKGRGEQRAMELLVALGEIYGAKRLVPISSAHLSGVSYKTVGEGGIQFLEEMAEDCLVKIKTTLNPAGMDLDQWKEMGITSHFAERQSRIIQCYRKMGVEESCTCTPYLTSNLPHIGDTVAWAESSALSYINSVIGARTNREGGPGALAAAVLGKTPEYGLHLDGNRMPTTVVEVTENDLDYSLLGQAVGPSIGGGIPYFKGIKPNSDQLKTLAAAMAAAGSVALFHVEDLTPNSQAFSLSGLEKLQVGKEDLAKARDSMITGKDPELIALGCPHLSISEMRGIASILRNKKRRGDAEVWFCTSRQVSSECPREAEVLKRFGKLVCDTCMVVTPIEERFKCTATNSAKACNYLPTLCSQKVVFGGTRELLELVV